MSEYVAVRTFDADNPNFAIVIDGEVVSNFSFPKFAAGQMPDGLAMITAALKSNPTLVWTTEVIQPGSSWDGNTFTPPAG